MEEHPTTKLAHEIIANRRRYVSMPDRQDLARRLLAMQAVVDAAREAHALHMSVTVMAAPSEFYDALWKIDDALAALDKLKEER